jgi:hypothetical protein
MLGNIQPPPAPTEDQALHFMTEKLRGGENMGRNNYEVYVWNVADRYVRSLITVPQGLDIQDFVEKIISPFFTAAWALCRLGVLRPGPSPGRSHVFNTNHEEAQGYGITEFGRRWIAETPPTLPPLVGPMTDMLLSAGKDFGDAYKLRTQDAVLAYNGHAYFACCAMAGAAAEAILLKAAVAKLGQEKAEELYFNSRGRSQLQNSLLGQQTKGFRNEFERHTDLITYWRDQSAHGHQTEIKEGEAYMALSGLLRFAHFASDKWKDLTT